MKDLLIKCKYKGCEEIFVPSRDWQVYCSSNCRKKAWNERHNIKDLKALAKRIQELEASLNK